jgi:aminobenzoyl-glutamate utilization protein B
LNVSWGDAGSNSGLVSVEYTFQGESAHSAGSPWRGRSALDAVELMDIGWNFRREHLRLAQRSHYVITNGGDQPNVVPRNASVWYFFRELDYPSLLELWKAGDEMAQGASLMTKTTWTSRVLGSAWPNHGNKPIAEAMYKHIQAVGMPTWSDADQSLAVAVQKMLGNKETKGLSTKIEELKDPVKPEQRTGGGSDDIGDIMWSVPTVTLRFPSNIPGLPGHNWANAISMATPIAHKGATAGAKVVALTMIDILTQPELVKNAWDYFKNVQTKDIQYKPLLRPEDKPAIWLNKKIMSEYRERMKPMYYDPAKYDTYLDQLGIKYPTLEKK